MSCCCCNEEYDDVSRQQMDAPKSQSMNRDMEEDKKTVQVWRSRSQELTEHRSKYKSSLDTSNQNVHAMAEEPISLVKRPEADSPEERPKALVVEIDSGESDTDQLRETMIYHKIQDHHELDGLVYSISVDDSMESPHQIPPNTNANPPPRRVSPTAQRILPSRRDTAPIRSSSPVRYSPQRPDGHSTAVERNTPAATTSDKEALKPTASSTRDTMSDLPSHVDTETKERYLMAVKILRSTLIEKEKTLLPSEKDFLQRLLEDHDDESQQPTPSEAHVMALETASQILGTDPLFETESDFHVESVNSEAFLQLERDHSPNASKDLSVRSSPTLRADNKSSLLDIIPSASVISFGGREYPFVMLGDSAGLSTKVMTPVLFEALRGFFPYGIAEDNAWLKFATELHGSDLLTLLSRIRASKHTIFAIETNTGEVFGSFTSSPWRIQSSWYGSGEAFLWRLKKSRFLDGKRTYDNDNLLEVYPYTGHDDLIQYCSQTTVGIGGGSWAPGEERGQEGSPEGPGIMVDADLQGGETNPCATFENPILCNRKNKNSVFNIVAFEAWTVTPVEKEQEAERLELRRLFIEENSG